MPRNDFSDDNRGLKRAYYQLKASGIHFGQHNPHRSGIHHRGYLPHIKREGASYFVTFRLADSLPQSVLMNFERERAQKLQSVARQQPGSRLKLEERINRDHQWNIERYLDLGKGECHLAKPEIAQLVADAMRYFDGERYQLDEWVVMPNHVHAIVWPAINQLLGDILRSWKRYTAREANKILGRTGQPFWQPESYDHWIRDEEEKARIRRYIRDNPVKANLCATPETWPWGSASAT